MYSSASLGKEKINEVENAEHKASLRAAARPSMRRIPS